MSEQAESRFPDPLKAPDDEPAAWGGSLSVEWLLDAYAHGYFPWFNEGEPVLWWCPNPRFVLLPERLKVSRSLAKELNKKHWKVTYDHAFKEVIYACARMQRPKQNGTWIIEEMQDAYLRLHESGYAHSVECWREGQLVGGLYGVSIGGVFFGESMFHTCSNASKVAFVTLVKELVAAGFKLIDCQQPTQYLQSFGAEAWAREDFLKFLNEALRGKTLKGNWRVGALGQQNND